MSVENNGSAQISPTERSKLVAAARAVAFVESGMRVGLGTGSTAAWMVKCLAHRVRCESLSLTTVATSTRTAELARSLGLKVVDLDSVGTLDLTIDGADEFDAELNLIKGGGGALLQEKIVATASDKMIVITDPSKEVPRLGAFPLPVEVIPFGRAASQRLIERLLADVDVGGTGIRLRMNGDAPFVTDEGNHILDLDLNYIADAELLSMHINQVPGVVENGLFLNICDCVISGHVSGGVQIFDRARGAVTQEQFDPVKTDKLLAELIN